MQLPTSQTNVEARPLASRGTTVLSGPEEEAVVYSQSRMLQDPTGRVLYIGDSATLSFLQLLRMMVETVVGSSPFTNDPRRHKIVEGQYSLPPGYRHVCELATHSVKTGDDSRSTLHEVCPRWTFYVLREFLTVVYNIHHISRS